MWERWTFNTKIKRRLFCASALTSIRSAPLLPADPKCLEAASVTLGTEQTSWEREAAPSPSSDPTKWLAATTAEEEDDEEDELPPPPDISDQPAAAERSE